MDIGLKLRGIQFAPTKSVLAVKSSFTPMMIEQILLYLREHPDAEDAAEGIHKFWFVGSSPPHYFRGSSKYPEFSCGTRMADRFRQTCDPETLPAE